MNIPDEDVDEYIQTRLAARQKNGYVIRFMKAGLPLHSPGSDRRSAHVARVSGSEDTGAAQHSSTNSHRQ